VLNRTSRIEDHATLQVLVVRHRSTARSADALALTARTRAVPLVLDGEPAQLIAALAAWSASITLQRVAFVCVTPSVVVTKVKTVGKQAVLAAATVLRVARTVSMKRRANAEHASLSPAWAFHKWNEHRVLSILRN
jgi:hypothetical protein